MIDLDGVPGQLFAWIADADDTDAALSTWTQHKL